MAEPAPVLKTGGWGLEVCQDRGVADPASPPRTTTDGIEFGREQEIEEPAFVPTTGAHKLNSADVEM